MFCQLLALRFAHLDMGCEVVWDGRARTIERICMGDEAKGTQCPRVVRTTRRDLYAGRTLVVDGRECFCANRGQIDRLVYRVVNFSNENTTRGIRAMSVPYIEESHAHLVTLDEVKPERDLLDALFKTVHALLGFR